jgi:hypothetical protein
MSFPLQTDTLLSLAAIFITIATAWEKLAKLIRWLRKRKKP